MYACLCFVCFFTQYVTDALVEMDKAMKRDNIRVNDRQLACAKISSKEGQNYLKAMAAAANYAWVNRSSMTFLTRQVRPQTKLFITIYLMFHCHTSTTLMYVHTVSYMLDQTLLSNSGRSISSLPTFFT